MINNVLLPLGFIIIIWLHSLKTDTNNTFKMCLQTIHITIYSDTLLEFYRLFLKNNVIIVQVQGAMLSNAQALEVEK